MRVVDAPTSDGFRRSALGQPLHLQVLAGL
jgi:hypothetical protein